MKKDIILRKFNSYIENIEDSLDDIASLLEIDNEDPELSEMSVMFREQVENVLTTNDECNATDIVTYIKENL